MKLKLLFTFLLLGLLSSGLTAQQKDITLDDIWVKGMFYPQRMASLSVLHNTNEYVVLNHNRQTGTSQVDVYDFATLAKVRTLFDTSKFTEISYISEYIFSRDEQRMLIATNDEPIYRHSQVAEYYLFDIERQKLEKITDKKIQEPLFSADGKKIAYAFNNNLYLYDLETKKEHQITSDGVKNKVINGITDWVYEEEFGFVRAFDWNADGTQLAYLRFDETDVPVFSMDIYGEGLYPEQQVFKYPKAGENNAKVTLFLYDVAKQQSTEIVLGAYYIPRLSWTNDANILSVQTLNRHQNDFNLIFVDAKSHTHKTILNEKNNTYVDITDNLTFLRDNSFIFTSEKSGFNHLYHYDKTGKLKKQLTSGQWEVTNFYGVDEKNQLIFYQSTENGSINRGVYSIGLNGKNKKHLSVTNGTNEATFSPDFSLYINQFSSVTQPPLYTLNSSKTGRQLKQIVDNLPLTERLKQYRLPSKEFVEISNRKGDKLNAYIIKPSDFNPNQKYPLLMYQYSGPGSQEVKNSWLDSNDFWHMLLAQKGYVVACVDGRGTGFKGEAFKKCTYKELGKYEVEDQTDAAKTFSGYSYIDSQRIGIWGWSFGGFMSSNCLFQSAEVFKAAIAVAPVTSWRFYDTIYTERFMQTPQENASGYDNNSPITHAEKLQGNYLLIHGTADDNVHVQNAMILINRLVSLNKNFDWLIYPDKNHGIYGGKTRLQLYTKMTDYILEKL